MDALWNDFVSAFRALRGKPGFAVTALLTLALGIGATTSVFTVLKAVLYKPLPYPEPERVVYLWQRNADRNIPRFPLSPPDFEDFQSRSTAFDSLAAIQLSTFNLTGDGEPQRLVGARVTADYFRLLGLELKGRDFAAEESRLGGEAVVIISDGFWNRHFGADESAIGKSLNLDGTAHAVVGIAPPGFPFARDVWTPLAIDFQSANRGFRSLSVIGRLKDGVSHEEANAEIGNLAAGLASQYPATNTGWDAYAQPMRDFLNAGTGGPLWMLFAMVALVLLIACVNVANLTLARLASRNREIALRSAIGAGRGRLLRQLLTESTILALCGGLLGWLLAIGGTKLLVLLYTNDSAQVAGTRTDATIFLFTLGVSLVTALLFGLLPALGASRTDLSEALKGGGRTQSGGGSLRLRSGLVLAQVALALLLLAGAALLTQSFRSLLEVDLGFKPDDALTLSLVLPRGEYANPERQRLFYRQLAEGLESLPGAEQAGFGFPLPMSGQNMMRTFNIAGRPEPEPDREPLAGLRVVSPDYLRAMGIQLLRGRDFTTEDNAAGAPVALVNRQAVRRYWPDEEPIGQRLALNTQQPGEPTWMEVVGVVGDVRFEQPGEEPGPELYVPTLQNPLLVTTVVLRSTQPPTSLAQSLRGLVGEIDPDLPLFDARTLEQSVGAAMLRPRFNAVLLSTFAGFALLLAALGLYGVSSYGVQQRWRELGIRQALGASRETILRMVLRQGMTPVLIGILVGVGLAWLLSRLAANVLGPMLHGVSAMDLATLAGVTLVLLATGLLACFLPARLATRADPAVVLRDD